MMNSSAAVAGTQSQGDLQCQIVPDLDVCQRHLKTNRNSRFVVDKDGHYRMAIPPTTNLTMITSKASNLWEELDLLYALLISLHPVRASLLLYPPVSWRIGKKTAERIMRTRKEVCLLQ